MKQVFRLLLVLLCWPAAGAMAQISVSNPASLPDVSAMLDVKSNTKGMLIPRMSSQERIAIGTPAKGLMVFDTDTNTFWFYNASSWAELSAGSSGANYWTSDGTNIYNNNSGKILLGTSAVGPGFFNIKAPLGLVGLFMSETGTASSDYLFSEIYNGGGTSSTRYGGLIGNFGNGFTIANQSNAYLSFQVYNAERMRMLPTGQVGINTTTPTSQLEVKSATQAAGITSTDGTVRLSTIINGTNAAIGTTTNHHLFFFTNNNINNNPPAMIISTAGSVGIGGSIPTDKLEVFTSAPAYGITHTAGAVSMGTYLTTTAGWLGTKTNHPLYLYAYSTNSYMTLLQNGNVGIGGATPTDKLEVFTSAPGYGVTHSAGAVSVGTYITSAGGWLGTKSNHPLYLYAYSTNSSMVLLQNGNVGIGTTNPAYKLSVNGSIQTKEVRVESGWADFVFEKDYHLRPLSEVETYIHKNKHLPEMPPAADIQKNGLAVAETETKMMQKIEELTLYIIDMQKEIANLKTKLNENK